MNLIYYACKPCTQVNAQFESMLFGKGSNILFFHSITMYSILLLFLNTISVKKYGYILSISLTFILIPTLQLQVLYLLFFTVITIYNHSYYSKVHLAILRFQFLLSVRFLLFCDFSKHIKRNVCKSSCPIKFKDVKCFTFSLGSN